MIISFSSCFNFDGFVKSPFAALRCIPCPVECRFAALLRRIRAGKSLRRTYKYASFSGFARLASEAFSVAIPILSFYDFINFNLKAWRIWAINDSYGLSDDFQREDTRLASMDKSASPRFIEFVSGNS